MGYETRCPLRSEMKPVPKSAGPLSLATSNGDYYPQRKSILTQKTG